MRIPALFLVLLLSCSPVWAQQKPATRPAPAAHSGRYQLMPVGESSVIKIDTWTGTSWKAINCPNEITFPVKYTAMMGGYWAKMPVIDP